MALPVREFLATKQITVLERPAYSPDLFPKIKETLKGKHFDDTDDIRSNTMAALNAIPQGMKVTMVVFSNEVCSTFTVMSSRTLSSDYVSMMFMYVVLKVK